MVANAEQMHSLLDTELAAVGSGVQTFVVCSTVGTHAMRVAERGRSAVDLAVTGGVQGAIDGTLSLFAAGDAALIARLKPVLSTMDRQCGWCCGLQRHRQLFARHYPDVYPHGGPGQQGRLGR